MTQITYYQQSSWGTHNKMKQEELQKMAQKISKSCKITEIYHHSYATNNPEQCKKGEDFAHIENGSMAIRYESDILPITYTIHFDCGFVTEIIEAIEIEQKQQIK